MELECLELHDGVSRNSSYDVRMSRGLVEHVYVLESSYRTADRGPPHIHIKCYGKSSSLCCFSSGSEPHHFDDSSNQAQHESVTTKSSFNSAPDCTACDNQMLYKWPYCVSTPDTQPHVDPVVMRRPLHSSDRSFLAHTRCAHGPQEKFDVS
jgi:hypothetical protein